MNERACSWRSGCDRRAWWSVTSLCCGWVDLLCDEHRARRIEFLAAWPDSWVVHNVCGGRGALVRWRRLVEAVA